MALDHYVSQVYLRNFCSNELANNLYAVRKSDLLEFTPRPGDVCRIEEGNTNPFLAEPRVVEDFLKTIEPHYNQALEKIGNDKIDRDSIYVIAGFTAYVMAASPTASRLSEPFLNRSVQSLGKMLDARGKLPTSPEELGGKTFSELINSGEINIAVDEKYPQSLGIANIIKVTQALGNFHWEILENDLSFSPFLTSDYPVVLKETKNPLIIDRLVPLSPTLAVHMYTNPDTKDKEDKDFYFSSFSYSRVKSSPDTIRKVNTEVVKCAENIVFSSQSGKWLKQFVKKHRDFRIEGLVDQMPTEKGSIIMTRHRIVRHVKQRS